MSQPRFWRELHQLKVQTLFIQKLLLRAERSERWTKITFAITSSTSIGAWVIWQEWAWIWGAIIAASQVLYAIYPHLPYRDRLKIYSSILRDFEYLFIDAEDEWQSVSDGSMSNKQINKACLKLQRKKTAILNKHMPNGVFPSNSKISSQAEREAESYFTYHYPIDESDESAESIQLS
ncbi:hypothetical protein [Acidihalobacter prosperus]|uniref:hypothetical protein n=1 Tax=Acidihalobacter prosperus TaxID=160660 RepID=UPI0011AB619A|nr:hypothetical protein [Acidihalobacter prosperus]